MKNYMKNYMKKILSFIFMFGALFIFSPNVYATQPGGIGYDGPDEVKQGETVTYNLTMRDGNVFYMLMEEYITETLDYDSSVFEFVSFSSEIEGISAKQSGSNIEMQVLRKAAGPYESDDIIGTIIFKVLDNAVIGDTVLVAPGSGEMGSSNQYKVVNILSSETISEDSNNEVVENQSIIENIDDNVIYIIIGSLLLLNIASLTTVIILIIRNKK